MPVHTGSPAAGFIDLHSHTNESDGTLTPEELINLAGRSGLAALAITDHDTFDGYLRALPYAQASGFDLVRGIELNSHFQRRPDAPLRWVHVLAYFPTHEPTAGFEQWLIEQRDERRSRNRKLVQALQERGVNISLAEVEARGKSITGRPHFARILVEKGYAPNIEGAFREYIGEEAPSFVQRESQTTDEVMRIVRSGGGIPVLAHPVRIGLQPSDERTVFSRWKDAGLLGLEIYHSEHPPILQAHYRQLTEELGLLPTGGSDFHGAVKPGIELGHGLNGNVRVPVEFLEGLRAYRSH